VKDRARNISIRKMIIIVFIFAMLFSMSGIGYLVFANWFSSAGKATQTIADEMNEGTLAKVNSLLQLPEQIIEVNRRMISSGILDLANAAHRDKFLVGVLDSYGPEIYSFSYGTAGGEYYGARRSAQGVIEIMRNNAGTGGNSWYYAVNDDMSSGDLLMKAGQFDPRTRAWYKAVVEIKGPSFSPIYKHFIMDDLTISYAWPHYGEQGELLGVLGTHMLLMGIGDYLEDAVREYEGYAVIFEKSSGKLIANSLGAANFTLNEDGTLKRIGLDEMENADFAGAYQRYIRDAQPGFSYRGSERTLLVNIKETHRAGLDWVVIAAIPEQLLIAPAVQSITLAALLAAFALLVITLVYNRIAGWLLRPVSSLVQVSQALSSGDLDKRVDIARYDEIGKISASFNNMADNMQFLVNNLEATVKRRTEELGNTNQRLEDKGEELRLILDSTAEAIYGIDIRGNCTFCNLSCISLLGYASQDELLEKNMHDKIHHSRADGTPLPVEECKIIQAFREKKGTSADDEVFWKADGTSFAIEYHSYPQFKGGEVIGAVVTFMDITERKRKDSEIQYLSYHDELTGLYNRRYFEDVRQKVDVPNRFPISVVFADINGLKMTNDIFGHSAGDELIKKAALILARSCREYDIVARVGGDEFCILLPNASEENVTMILERIKEGFAFARVEAIKCSISLGSDTKRNADKSLDETMANAENAMYKDKITSRQAISNDIVETIIQALHEKNPGEKRHAAAVSNLCGELGRALGLDQAKVIRLRRAGYLHDIGKIVLDESALAGRNMTAEETEKVRQHPVFGYRILNLLDDMLDLAEYVYSHHERWDGSGYPRGLSGGQIPLESRIIAAAEAYDRVLNRGDLPLENREILAADVIEKGAGTQFDPRIARLLLQVLNDKFTGGAS